jgi:DNA primase
MSTTTAGAAGEGELTLVRFFADGSIVAGQPQRMVFGLADADHILLADAPAELQIRVQRDGAEAVATVMSSSVPLVRFQVERVLDTAPLENAEGKDEAIAALRPIFADLPASVMRQELLALVAGRLDLPDALVADLLGGQRSPTGTSDRPRVAEGNGDASPRRAVSPAERIERTFLALCIALPNQGREALADVSGEHFSNDLLRRAADHLREHVDEPTETIAEDDQELLALVRELAVRADSGNPTRETLAVERLQLELARLDRAIGHARTEGAGGVSGLVAQRRTVKEELDAAMDAALAASAPTPGDD